MRPEYTIMVVSRDGASQLCDPVGEGSPAESKPGWSEIRLGPRLKRAGAGSFTCRALPDLVAAVDTPGARVVAWRKTGPGSLPTVEMSGPIEGPELGHTAEDDGVDGLGRLQVAFADDFARAAGRTVYPNPALASTAQVVARYSVAAGNAEDRIRALFDTNAGPSALVARRLAGVTLGADLGLASTIAATSFTRDVPLMDALRKLASQQMAGGLGLGFRLGQVGNGCQFQVFAPRDLSAQIIFSRTMGNVVSMVHTREAPTCTVAIVGDATAGAGRVVRERINTVAIAAGWERLEEFVDARGAQNAAEMDQAGDKALADGAPKERVVAVVRESPAQRWRHDFWLGDQVTIVPRPGVLLSRLVIGADYEVTAEGGEKITPVIGDETEILAPKAVVEMYRLEQRIAAIEGAL